MKQLILLLILLIICTTKLIAQQIYYANKSLKITTDTPFRNDITYLEDYCTNFIEKKMQILILNTDNFKLNNLKITEWKIDTNKFLIHLKKGGYGRYNYNSKKILFKDNSDFIIGEFIIPHHAPILKLFAKRLKKINILNSINGKVFKLGEKEYFLLDNKNLQNQYYINKDTLYYLKPKSLNFKFRTIKKFNKIYYKIIKKFKLESMGKKEYDKLLKPYNSYWDVIN